MSAFYAIRVVDGRHQVGVTTDGRDFAPLPRAAFGKPRDAIRYAEMRQRNVSPLRDGLDDGDFQLIAESAHPDSLSPWQEVNSRRPDSPWKGNRDGGTS